MPENKGLERFPVDPAKFGGYKDFTLAGHEDLGRQLVAERPDITLAELEDRLKKKKITVGKSSISRFLHHLELPFKNSLRAAEQDRPDVAAARRKRDLIREGWYSSIKPPHLRRLPVCTAEHRRVNGSSKKCCTETGRPLHASQRCVTTA
jgi:hypothetical protein